MTGAYQWLKDMDPEIKKMIAFLCAGFFLLGMSCGIGFVTFLSFY